MCSILFAFLLRFSFGAQQVFYQMFFSLAEEKAEAYVNWNIQWGFLIYWLMELLFIFVAYRAHKDQSEKNTSAKYGNIFWINIVLACMFPLLTVNINFYRIYRNVLIYNYALFEASVIQRKRYAVLIVFIVAVVLSYYMNIMGDIDNVFWVFFRFA